MGEYKVQLESPDQTRAFTDRLLRDLHVLELMLEGRMFESGVRRIGAEQELFLVDRSWRPAPINMEVLGRIDDPAFTTELGRFNLEINLEPLSYGGDALSQLERDIKDKLGYLAELLEEFGATYVLTGILPTLRKSDLSPNNMTPKGRYSGLDEAMRSYRDGAFQVHIKGIDEVFLEHDSVMLEAACTSFQVHMQVDPQDFAQVYNLAQVAIAPVIAAAANSPLLFGRRLWKESRIPLFQQSIDTRNALYHLRERRPRVGFGSRWVDGSILELFRQAVARFPVLMCADSDEDPLEKVRRGETPKLAALQVHNGTVYRWNRPCYGVYRSKPHLRIEMRGLASGPTVVDEVANAAFFFGLVDGLRAEVGDVCKRMDFHDARVNFAAAAELGLDAQFHWIDGVIAPAQGLICEQLLPLARQGLESAGIGPADVERYLGVIEERVASGRTGAQWMLGSYARIRDAGTPDEIFTALTAATSGRQREDKPVHWWPWAEVSEGITMEPEEIRVEEFMSTDLATVDPEEPVSLAVHLMEWRHVRHMPVEDKQGVLVGMLSVFDVIRQFGSESYRGGQTARPVGEFMNREVTTVAPETNMLDAIGLLRSNEVDCLPVVQEGKLVGIVTEHDFLHIVTRLLTRRQGK